jgi:hypothetical protein
MTDDLSIIDDLITLELERQRSHDADDNDDTLDMTAVPVWPIVAGLN